MRKTKDLNMKKKKKIVKCELIKKIVINENSSK